MSCGLEDLDDNEELKFYKEPLISKKQFLLSLSLIAQVLYDVEDPFEHLLTYNLVASKNEEALNNPTTISKPIAFHLSKGWMPKFDLLTPRLLSESAVVTYLHFIEQLEGLYLNIHLKSLKERQNMFTWHAAIKKELTINVKSIIAMCIKLQLIPSCFTIDNLHNHILAVAPP